MGQRSRIHLTYRLALRGYQFATSRRPDGSRRWSRTATSLACDLGIAALMRRSEKSLIELRLPLDVADIALWGRYMPSPPETPTLAGVPLAMEAGARWGAAGFGVPGATYAGLAWIRRRTGRDTPISTMGWQVLAVASSIFLERYEAFQNRITAGRLEREVAARRSSAFLAGQNEVAMGADSVVDELGRVEHILATLSEGASSGGTGRALAEWKASLATATVVDTVYLGTFLARWERARRQPDLSADVEVELPPGAGTTIITSSQAAWLARTLDAIGLRGTVKLDLEAEGKRVPGDPLVVSIDGCSIVVPADAEQVPRKVDARPFAVALGFFWSLSSSSRSHGDVPLQVGIPASSLSLALAWWAHRGLDRELITEHQVLLASLVVAGVQSVLQTPHQRALFNSDGIRHLPIQQNLLAPALFASTYQHRLTKPQIAQIAALTTVAIAAGILRAEGEVKLRDLALDMTWVAAAYLSIGSVQSELEEVNARQAEEQARETRIELEEAWLAGRSSVLDLVEASWAEAAERLQHGQQGPDAWIEPDMAAELQRRLATAKVQLDALRWTD
jgi:hypothetical protein